MKTFRKTVCLIHKKVWRECQWPIVLVVSRSSLRAGRSCHFTSEIRSMISKAGSKGILVCERNKHVTGPLWKSTVDVSEAGASIEIESLID